MRLLAFSSSRAGDSAYLEAAVPEIRRFLGEQSCTIAFIPFAAADNDYGAYGQKVREALSSLPYTIEVARHENAGVVLEQSDVIMVGGGNTFKLLHHLYHFQVLERIREKVKAGTPFIGWSAGSNITGRTICTTNDMPIIQPASFQALGFLPFQINPHYLNQTAEGFHGETRDQRLTEFLLVNPGVPVVGLPEGTALHLEGEKLQFMGKTAGVLFATDPATHQPVRKEIAAGMDLSYLLGNN